MGLLERTVFAASPQPTTTLRGIFCPRGITTPQCDQRGTKGFRKMNKTLAGRTLASLALCLLLSSSAFAASSKEDLQDRIDAAKTVLNQIMSAGDRSIPMNI